MSEQDPGTPGDRRIIGPARLVVTDDEWIKTLAEAAEIPFDRLRAVACGESDELSEAEEERLEEAMRFLQQRVAVWPESAGPLPPPGTGGFVGPPSGAAEPGEEPR